MPNPLKLLDSEQKVQRFWRLQHLARKVDLRLTADAWQFHLRDLAGADRSLPNLDGAEAAILSATPSGQPGHTGKAVPHE
jgi:hypothetical protein